VSTPAGRWASSTAGQGSPALARMMTGRALLRLREARGISHEAAAHAIRTSEDKIRRLELGRVRFRLRDVIGLCDLYGVTDHTDRVNLLSVARMANGPDWWHPYRDLVPGWFGTYLGLEQAASVIRSYEAGFVPGLLQTPGYARGVIELSHGTAPEQELERRVELRTRRQDLLRRAQPPHLWAVIDEAALRRPIGGRVTMAAQLRHLLNACTHDRVTIQVLTFARGGHAAGGGPISMLRLPAPELLDVVYLEQLTTAVYPDTPAEIEYYRHVLNLLTFQVEYFQRAETYMARQQGRHTAGGAGRGRDAPRPATRR
jgi:transcriptional regulator with XRE-family HTH domain